MVYTVLPNFQLSTVAVPNKSLTVYGYRVWPLCSRTIVWPGVHFLTWSFCVAHIACIVAVMMNYANLPALVLSKACGVSESVIAMPEQMISAMCCADRPW